MAKRSVDIGVHSLPDGTWARVTVHVYDNRLRDMILRAWQNKHRAAESTDSAFEVVLEPVTAEEALQPKQGELEAIYNTPDALRAALLLQGYDVPLQAISRRGAEKQSALYRWLLNGGEPPKWLALYAPEEEDADVGSSTS